MKVDTDGIQNRIVGLEITPGNYRNIRMLDDNRIFYLRRTAGDEVGEEDEQSFSDKDKKSHLCAYNLDDRKETVIGDANNYQITFDGKKMLVKIKKDYAIIDIPKDKIETKDHEHKIQGLDMQLDRRAEWRQIYSSAGGKCATSSSRRRWTASIGRRCATSTRRCCRS